MGLCVEKGVSLTMKPMQKLVLNVLQSDGFGAPRMDNGSENRGVRNAQNENTMRFTELSFVSM